STTKYYKLSCYDSYRGIYGHECVNELVASRLMDVLGIEHVAYKLVHAQVLVDGAEYVTWLSETRNFRRPGERKQALDLFYDLNKQPGESPLDLCERYGWLARVQQMMAVDFLIANRDRHGANVEVLRSPDGAVRLAPLFDNGLSFVFSCYGDEGRVAAFDELQDVAANNYVGTRSLEENLRFVPRNTLPNVLDEAACAHVTSGLEDVVPQAHREKIQSIVWQRWMHLRKLGIVVGGA
ncbi:MAG: hypothetical protein Q4C41_09185, partial [Eggerthellaceae bacterium]|nr:hypothetical protein [Eggerthellaceae bacterium]